MKKFLTERDILFKLLMLLPFVTGIGFICMYYVVFGVSLITKNPLAEFSLVGPLFMMILYVFSFGKAHKERSVRIILLFSLAQSQMVITAVIAVCAGIWIYFGKKPVITTA